MMTRVTRSGLPNFKVKIKSFLWLLVGYSLLTRCLLATIKQSQALVLNKSSMLHRKKFIGHAHSSQFME